MQNRILIHACCADCSLKLLDLIKSEIGLKNENITLFFFNPNIYPRSEYFERLNALKKMFKETGIKIIIPDYEPSSYFTSFNFKTSEVFFIEKNIRCPICWHLRLFETFNYAKEYGYKIVSTTLLTSTYQKREEVVKIGNTLAKDYELNFFIPKKVNSEIKTSGFYKQNYCGCLFSLNEKTKSKYAN